MRIIKDLPVLLVAIILFSSCQKEYSINPVVVRDSTSSMMLVKTYTEDLTMTSIGHTVTTYNLTYDSSNRLLTMVSSDSSTGDKFVYHYNSDNTYTTDIYSSNALIIHELSIVNPNGFVDSTIQYNDTHDTMTEKYTYNSAKQLTILKQYDYTTATGSVLSDVTKYEYDSDGNVTKEINQDFDITHDYYKDLLNNLSLGQVYFATSKNLTKTSTYTGGGYSETTTHTYTFDSLNRLTTDKSVTPSGEIVIKKYTY